MVAKKTRMGKGCRSSDGAEQEEVSSMESERTLYDLLNVSKDASMSEIKKAYHRLAIECHPDKRPDDPDAKDKFQQLQRVKEILLDEEKRRYYDEAGVIPEDGCFEGLKGKSFTELYEYYRAIYQTVTEDDYKSWEKKYPGSQEEKEDIAAFYKRKAGKMSRVCEYIPFCEKEDCWRIKTIIDEMIQQGELEETSAYKKFKPKQYSEEEVKKIKSRSAPEEGWEEAMAEFNSKKKKTNSKEDLAALILSKNRERKSAFDGMIAAMEMKYSKGKSKTKSKR